MNTTTKWVLGIIAGVVTMLVLVVVAVGVTLVVSNNDSSTTTTAPPAISDTPSTPGGSMAGVLEQTWSSRTPLEQSQLCSFFNSNPQGAWDAFNQGAQGVIPQADFYSFFSAKCGY